MAITDKEQGVWILDEVYNKQNEGGIWAIPSSVDDVHTMWSWGHNGYAVFSDQGQLGLNDVISRSSPTQIGTDNDWTSMSSSGNLGDEYAKFAIKANGTLWAWGANPKGSLGQNNLNDRSSPTQIGTGTDWKEVNGSGGGFATKTDGTLWAWGYNAYGQLGLNQGGDPAAPNISSPTQVPGTTWQLSNSKSSAGDGFFSIKTDGSLWGVGANHSGRLGQNQGFGAVAARSSPVQIGTDTNWSTVSASPSKVFAVKTDGTAWAWGRNEYGELGQNSQGPSSNSARSSPLQIGTDTNWVAFACSYNAVYAHKTDGTLWSWGRNLSGQLGLGSGTVTDMKSSPTQIGTDTTWSTIIGTVGTVEAGAMAIKADGTLWSWGYGQWGRGGHNNTASYSSPKQVGSGTKWARVYGCNNSVLAFQNL